MKTILEEYIKNSLSYFTFLRKLAELEDNEELEKIYDEIINHFTFIKETYDNIYNK